MEESEVKQLSDGQKKGHEPNWVEQGTFWVLCATLAAACFAAFFTGRQSILMREALESDSRPIIVMGFDGDRTQIAEAGKPLRFHVLVVNTGRFQTQVSLQHGVTVAPNLEGIPPLNGKETIEQVRPMISFGPRALVAGIEIESPFELTEGQVTDLRNGKARVWVYVVATYGGKKEYETAMCSVLRSAPSSGSIVLLESAEVSCDQRTDRAK